MSKPAGASVCAASFNKLQKHIDSQRHIGRFQNCHRLQTPLSSVLICSSDSPVVQITTGVFASHAVGSINPSIAFAEQKSMITSAETVTLIQ